MRWGGLDTRFWEIMAGAGPMDGDGWTDFGPTADSVDYCQNMPSTP